MKWLPVLCLVLSQSMARAQVFNDHGTYIVDPSTGAEDFIASADGSTDISDAVATLTDLFIGTQNVTCRTAADSNDDGAVDISDAVFLLTYLFLGGQAPDEPLGSCGIDPTPDALLCDSFSRCQ